MKKNADITDAKKAKELAPDVLEQIAGGIPEPVKRKDKADDKARPKGVPEPVRR